jgi:4-diphosphocytidyl-2-C-methyl-D-erythritol kinase
LPRPSAAGARPLAEFAPAKVNLTLAVRGRRADGYHDLESLVVFASVGDRLELEPGGDLRLVVRGPTAKAAGAVQDNLVLKAAAALAARVPTLRAGAFTLVKRLPVAAGLGGGSADAAAALRLLAQANGLAASDERLLAAAAATGADVPVCLASRARMMRGRGEVLAAPLDLPRLPAVLVNPGVALPTRDVFSACTPADAGPPDGEEPSAEGLAAFLARHGNDLEAPAIRLQPVIAEVLEALRACAGARLARMSGSGATCFALFPSARAAARAARALREAHPAWWVRPTALG